MTEEIKYPRKGTLRTTQKQKIIFRLSTMEPSVLYCCEADTGKIICCYDRKLFEKFQAEDTDATEDNGA